jgi:hypothetical protein
MHGGAGCFCYVICHDALFSRFLRFWDGTMAMKSFNLCRQNKAHDSSGKDPYSFSAAEARLIMVSHGCNVRLLPCLGTSHTRLPAFCV